MSSVLILVRSKFSGVPAMKVLRDFHESVSAELKNVEGFVDSHVWVNIASPERHLVLYRYASVESADSGLKVVTRDGILSQSQSVQTEAADVMRVRVLKEFGNLKNELSGAKILSLSVRVAEPGFALEMQEDLETVFEECRFLEGFEGYIIGANDTLDEEVVGLASWDSEEAFLSSLPKGFIPDVLSYRKAW